MGRSTQPPAFPLHLRASLQVRPTTLLDSWISPRCVLPSSILSRSLSTNWQVVISVLAVWRERSEVSCTTPTFYLPLARKKTLRINPTNAFILLTTSSLLSPVRAFFVNCCILYAPCLRPSPVLKSCKCILHRLRSVHIPPNRYGRSCSFEFTGIGLRST